MGFLGRSLRAPRMATADEDVDSRAIANHAADQIREGLESGGALRRLEDVAAADDVAAPVRPRASADDALVPEPPEPADHEVSFRLRDPNKLRAGVHAAFTGRHALTGDLQPKTLLASAPGEDEDVPGAIATAAADTDVDAPGAADNAKPLDAADQEIAPGDRSSPADTREHDADAQGRDMDDLEAAQRGRRVRTGVQAGLRGLQFLMAAIGGARNIPGLAAASSIAGVASGAVDPQRPVQEFTERNALNEQVRRREDKARADALEMEQQAIQNKRSDRQLAINEGNMEAGIQNAAASRAEQARLNQARLDETFEKTDPTSRTAANARVTLRDSLDLLRSARPDLQGIGDAYNDVEQNMENMSADELNAIREGVEGAMRLPQGARVRRGGHGNGGARPTRPVGVSPEQDQADYEQALQLVNDKTHIPINLLRRRYPIEHAYDDGPRDLMSLLTSQGAADVNMEQRQDLENQEMVVPGWGRSPNAPRLTPNQAQEARNRASSFDLVSTFSQQMQRLSRKIGAMQAAGESANLINEEVGRAMHIHEQLISALRELGNYGVPNGTELQRMEALAPSLTSARGILSAGPIYEGLRRTMWDRTVIKMRGDGYAPGGR